MYARASRSLEEMTLIGIAIPGDELGTCWTSTACTTSLPRKRHGSGSSKGACKRETAHRKTAGKGVERYTCFFASAEAMRGKDSRKKTHPFPLLSWLLRMSVW